MDKPARIRASKSIPPTVIRGVVAILLGAATTVGIAWLLALLVDGGHVGYNDVVALQGIPMQPGYAPAQPPGAFFAQATREQSWGTVIVKVDTVWSGDGGPSVGSMFEVLDGTSFAEQMKDNFDSDVAPTAWWRADGWPMLALSAEAWWDEKWGGLVPDRKRVSKVVGGVLAGPRRVTPYGTGPAVRVLPLQPIWSGLVINTAFYEFLWFALLSLGDIRFAIRRRRGLCTRCAYKLQPEQGSLQRMRRATAVTIVSHRPESATTLSKISPMRALSKPIPPFVVRVTAAILLGVATTVGVAWLLAWYVDGTRKSRWPRWPGFNYDVASKVIPTPTDANGSPFNRGEARQPLGN